MPFEQLIQIIGMVFILLAFIALQTKRMSATSVLYLVINIVGSGILTVSAYMTQQWGFVGLEGVWGLVAAIGLIQKVLNHQNPVSPRPIHKK